MKTCIALVMSLMAAGAAVRAQDVPIDVQTLNEIKGFRTEMNGTELNNKIAQLLEEAKKQVDRLDQQLQRTGAYDQPPAPGVTAAQNVLVASAAGNLSKETGTMLRTSAELGAERDAVKGSDVFAFKDTETENAMAGVFKPIGETYVDKDGKEVKRDESKYKSDAIALNNLKEYYRVHNNAIAKQQELEAARVDAQVALLEAENEVQARQLSSLIGSLDSELIAVRLDIANASANVQTQERALALQSTVDAKAGADTTNANRGRRPTLEEIKAILAGMPGGGKTGKHDKEGRVHFGPINSTQTPPAGNDPLGAP